MPSGGAKKQRPDTLELEVFAQPAEDSKNRKPKEAGELSRLAAPEIEASTSRPPPASRRWFRFGRSQNPNNPSLHTASSTAEPHSATLAKPETTTIGNSATTLASPSSVPLPATQTIPDVAAVLSRSNSKRRQRGKQKSEALFSIATLEPCPVEAPQTQPKSVPNVFNERDDDFDRGYEDRTRPASTINIASREPGKTERATIFIDDGVTRQQYLLNSETLGDDEQPPTAGWKSSLISMLGKLAIWKHSNCYGKQRGRGRRKSWTSGGNTSESAANEKCGDFEGFTTTPVSVGYGGSSGGGGGGFYDKAGDKELSGLRRLSQVRRRRSSYYFSENERRIRANNREFNAQFKYTDNYIKTSKYSMLTFLPFNLLEQFQRLANFYFLCLLVLQLIPAISSLTPVTTAIPLIGVLTLTAVKDAYDDIQRHLSDSQVNNRKSKALKNGKLVDEKWSGVQVGDVIRLENNQFVAADILLLSTSEPNGLCFIETAELDGETNLKCKQCLAETIELGQRHDLLWHFNGEIICERPNNLLNKFEGTLIWRNQRFALDNEKVLLRGCVLRNTQWCYGVVIFAGKDTKLMQNSGKTQFKSTGVDRLLNFIIIGIVLFLLSICAFFTVACGIWEYLIGQHFQVYLPWENIIPKSVPEGATVIGLLVFFSYAIVLNTVVPISLYVSVEVIRFAQSFLINWDDQMYYEPTKTHAKARTTTLNEELGQIQYIFSDKTGTLTQNIMTFNKCSINGRTYGDVIDLRTGEVIELTDKHTNFHSYNSVNNSHSHGNKNKDNNSTCSPTPQQQQQQQQPKPQPQPPPTTTILLHKAEVHPKTTLIVTTAATSATTPLSEQHVVLGKGILSPTTTTTPPTISTPISPPAQHRRSVAFSKQQERNFDQQQQNDYELATPSSPTLSWSSLTSSVGAAASCKPRFKRQPSANSDIAGDKVMILQPADQAKAKKRPIIVSCSNLYNHHNHSSRHKNAKLNGNTTTITNTQHLLTSPQAPQKQQPKAQSPSDDEEIQQAVDDDDVYDDTGTLHSTSTNHKYNNNNNNFRQHTNTTSFCSTRKSIRTNLSPGAHKSVYSTNIYATNWMTPYHRKVHALQPIDFSANPQYEPDFRWYDRTLLDAVRSDEEHAHNFFRLLALCHTVMPEYVDGRLEYQAQSPDESALVSAARNFGFVFRSRTPNSITIEVMGRTEDYELLHILDFNNVRKRMSVILRRGRNILLYCKGADNVIYDRLASSQNDIKARTQEHLNKFAGEGLRTLVLAERRLDESYYTEWRLRQQEAAISLDHREDKLAAIYEEIESEMVLVGVTAIEDKLQDGVPETIANLQMAGIKIWVLTGDKQETAINIGYSCQLLTDELADVFIVDGSSKEEVEIQLRQFRDSIRIVNRFRPTPVEPQSMSLNGSHRNNASAMMGSAFRAQMVATSPPAPQPPPAISVVTFRWDNDRIKRNKGEPDSAECNEYYDNLEKGSAGDKSTIQDDLTVDEGTGFAIVINGHSLVHCLSPELESRFLEIASQCKAVICCRVTPLQKALVVELIKRAKNAVTLAIGDGANDVSMIKAAHIGVGISGQEGMQAVLASDYSIAQFRYLERLLLVHGRWSYYRMCKFLRYFFYKNFAFTLCHCWYSFFCGFSAQTVFDPMFISVYNLFYTSLPVLALGVFEQDVSDKHSVEYPKLYTPGLKSQLFNTKEFVYSVLHGAFSSMILFLIPYGTYKDGVSPNGLILSDHMTLGAVVATILIIDNTAQIALYTSYWTVFNHITIWGSLIWYFVLDYFYNYVIGGPYVGSLTQAMQDLTFWVTMLITVTMIMAPVLAYKFYLLAVHPSLSDKIRYKRRQADLLTRQTQSSVTRTPSARKARSSLRSGYAFDHQEGFGRLITSGKIMRKLPQELAFPLGLGSKRVKSTPTSPTNVFTAQNNNNVNAAKDTPTVNNVSPSANGRLEDDMSPRAPYQDLDTINL